MKYTRYGAAVVVLLLLFSMAVQGQEVKQETKAGTVAQEAKPETKQEAAAPETKQEVKPEAKQDTHSGPLVKEKRVFATMDFDGVQRVEISGGEYYFDPNTIVVKVNKPVELKVKKGADTSWLVPLNLMSQAPEAGIDFIVDLKKDPQSVHFTPTKTGKYPMYCDHKPPFGGKSHRERGMEGVIEVVE